MGPTSWALKTWNADGWYAKDCIGGPLEIAISGRKSYAFAAQIIELHGADKTAPIDGTNAAPGGANILNLSSGPSSTASTGGRYVIGWTTYVTDARRPAPSGTLSSYSGAVLMLSSRAFTPVLDSQTDEPQVNAIGTDTDLGSPCRMA